VNFADSARVNVANDDLDQNLIGDHFLIVMRGVKAVKSYWYGIC